MWTPGIRNDILIFMSDTQPDMPPPPPRPPWAQRVRPWVELISRLLAALAYAIAIWKELG